MLLGEITDAVRFNPLGVLAAVAGIVILPFLLADFFLGRQMVYRAYLKGEMWLKQPLVAVSFAALILANWIWNMSKGL